MRRQRLAALAALLLALPGTLARAAASMRVEVFNTRRELSGRMWGAGNWIAFCTDESSRDLNGDGDVDDTVLQVFDARALTVFNTGLALDTTLVDGSDDWPVAISGDTMAVQVSELDNGRKDLDGNGRADDNVLHLLNLSTHRVTNLRVSGSRPTFLGGKLYFTRREEECGKDLNGDGDTADTVLCSYDLSSGEVESLGMDAAAGFQAAGDWIAAETSEAAQGGKDLNGDRDTADVVVQLYHLPEKKWFNTGLECSFGIELTPRLLAVGVDEAKQGGQDLNGDGDTRDIVCEVRDLTSGMVTNTGQDCSGDLVADGEVVGMVTSEKAQGNRDLNGDGDTLDEVAQVFTLASGKVVNLARDASGGIAAAAGRIAFSCSETAQGNRDLNGDRDATDYVMLVYDPAPNSVLNTRWAVDGDVNAREGVLAWTVLEADQGNTDLNRDGDTDDSVLLVMDLATSTVRPTGYASTGQVCVTGQAVGFGTSESDQGNRDLNGDGDTDDTIVQMAVIRRG